MPGRLGSRRHINLPGVKVRLPALTAKDRADIAVGVDEKVDFFALSFVREADDVDILRRVLSDAKSEARIIAKIEDQSGLANLDEIIVASDAIMVARGDLGIEVPMEELPLDPEAGDRRLHPAPQAGHRRHPSARVHDHLARADPGRGERHRRARSGPTADAIMLSGETTTGLYPLECVQIMKRVAGRIEHSAAKGYNAALPLKNHKDRLLRSAVLLAQEIGEAGIVVFTRSGDLPQALSALRAWRCPIYAFTDSPQVFRHLLLLWGVEPFLMRFFGRAGADDPGRLRLPASPRLGQDGRLAGRRHQRPRRREGRSTRSRCGRSNDAGAGPRPAGKNGFQMRPALSRVSPWN